MRDEKTMIELILRYAREHEEVRAAVMNGSRVNPGVPPDPWQDYDVVYFVRDVAPFRSDPSLVAFFGDPMIVQKPEEMGDPPRAGDGSFTCLMQFLDGTRIDLGIKPIAHLEQCLRDSLTRVLLDKDDFIGALPPPSEDSYRPRRPTRKEFDDCCNEFWWLNPYVAKGILRREMPYARHILDVTMRQQVEKMLAWYAGVRTGFRKTAGTYGRRLRSQIEPALWRSLERTHADHRWASTWRALLEMQRLFRVIAREVGAACGYTYPDREDAAVSAYVMDLRRIRGIPR